MNANNPITINVKHTIYHEDLEYVIENIKSTFNIKITKKQALKIYKFGLFSSGDSFNNEPTVISSSDYNGLFHYKEQIIEFLK